MIGSNFLKRITEAEEPQAKVMKDTVWNGIHSRMKRPYDKKIVQFFDLLGIPGRYVRGEEGLEDSIRAGGDILRRAGRKQSLFNQFFDQLSGAGGKIAEAKKGSRLQKILETVAVTLGFPASLVSSGEAPGPLSTIFRRAAANIEADGNLEATLIAFAKALGITAKQVNEAKEKKHYIQSNGSNIAGPFDSEDEAEAYLDKLLRKAKPEDELDDARIVLEDKKIKVREPGWYVVDWVDTPVAGPFTETGAREEAEEMNTKFKKQRARNSAEAGRGPRASDVKGDISAFDVTYFSDYDIRRMNEGAEHKFKPGDSVKIAYDKKSDYGRFLGRQGKVKSVSMKRKGVQTYIVKFGADEIIGFESDMELAKINETMGSRFKQRVLGEDVDVGQDEFMETVMKLVAALGIPEGLLQPRRQQIIRALRTKKQELTNRGVLVQRMNQLLGLIEKGTKAPSTGSVQESLREARESLSECKLFEAFGPLEALVGKSLQHFNADEPAAGPALMAGYEGSGSHEETVLVLAVDPDADDDNKSLRVGIDSPWDGGIHAKYFPNNKEGYKAAVDYANMLRTCNLKTGGRPKGWKDRA